MVSSGQSKSISKAVDSRKSWHVLGLSQDFEVTQSVVLQTSMAGRLVGTEDLEALLWAPPSAGPPSSLKALSLLRSMPPPRSADHDHAACSDVVTNCPPLI